MILGIGLDLVDPSRIAAVLHTRGDRFLGRVFTPAETRECEPRTDRVDAYAARFAAKEACLKALGTGWARGLGFRQVEVVRGEGGRPELRLSGAAAARAAELGVARCHLTMTHERGMAAAMVVMEG